jgi:hypothetical protein
MRNQQPPKKFKTEKKLNNKAYNQDKQEASLSHNRY